MDTRNFSLHASHTLPAEIWTNSMLDDGDAVEGNEKSRELVALLVLSKSAGGQNRWKDRWLEGTSTGITKYLKVDRSGERVKHILKLEDIAAVYSFTNAQQRGYFGERNRVPSSRSFFRRDPVLAQFFDMKETNSVVVVNQNGDVYVTLFSSHRNAKLYTRWLSRCGQPRAAHAGDPLCLTSGPTTEFDVHPNNMHRDGLPGKSKSSPPKNITQIRPFSQQREHPITTESPHAPTVTHELSSVFTIPAIEMAPKVASAEEVDLWEEGLQLDHSEVTRYYQNKVLSSTPSASRKVRTGNNPGPPLSPRMMSGSERGPIEIDVDIQEVSSVYLDSNYSGSLKGSPKSARTQHAPQTPKASHSPRGVSLLTFPEFSSPLAKSSQSPSAAKKVNKNPNVEELDHTDQNSDANGGVSCSQRPLERPIKSAESWRSVTRLSEMSPLSKDSPKGSPENIPLSAKDSFVTRNSDQKCISSGFIHSIPRLNESQNSLVEGLKKEGSGTSLNLDEKIMVGLSPRLRSSVTVPSPTFQNSGGTSSGSFSKPRPIAIPSLRTGLEMDGFNTSSFLDEDPVAAIDVTVVETNQSNPIMDEDEISPSPLLSEWSASRIHLPQPKKTGVTSEFDSQLQRVASDGEGTSPHPCEESERNGTASFSGAQSECVKKEAPTGIKDTFVYARAPVSPVITPSTPSEASMILHHKMHSHSPASEDAGAAPTARKGTPPKAMMQTFHPCSMGLDNKKSCFAGSSQTCRGHFAAQKLNELSDIRREIDQNRHAIWKEIQYIDRILLLR